MRRSLRTRNGRSLYPAAARSSGGASAWQIATASASAAWCGVGSSGEPEDHLHHPLHLRLLGAAVAADGLLDAGRRVLAAGDSRVGGRDEHGAACLSDGERDAGVGADVRLLECHRIRRVLGDERRHCVVDRLQTEDRVLPGGRRPAAVRHLPEAASAFLDDSVPASSSPRIDAYDLHDRKLRTRSDESCSGHDRDRVDVCVARHAQALPRRTPARLALGCAVPSRPSPARDPCSSTARVTARRRRRRVLDAFVSRSTAAATSPPGRTSSTSRLLADPQLRPAQRRESPVERSTSTRRDGSTCVRSSADVSLRSGHAGECQCGRVLQLDARDRSRSAGRVDHDATLGEKTRARPPSSTRRFITRDGPQLRPLERPRSKAAWSTAAAPEHASRDALDQAATSRVAEARTASSAQSRARTVHVRSSRQARTQGRRCSCHVGSSAIRRLDASVGSADGR